METAQLKHLTRTVTRTVETNKGQSSIKCRAKSAGKFEVLTKMAAEPRPALPFSTSQPSNQCELAPAPPIIVSPELGGRHEKSRVRIWAKLELRVGSQRARWNDAPRDNQAQTAQATRSKQIMARSRKQRRWNLHTTSEVGQRTQSLQCSSSGDSSSKQCCLHKQR